MGCIGSRRLSKPLFSSLSLQAPGVRLGGLGVGQRTRGLLFVVEAVDRLCVHACVCVSECVNSLRPFSVQCRCMLTLAVRSTQADVRDNTC